MSALAGFPAALNGIVVARELFDAQSASAI